MKIDMKSPEMQPLLADIQAQTLKHHLLLSKCDLKITLKSTLSLHDRLVTRLVYDYKLPIEIIGSVFEYLPVTFMIETLGVGFDQVMLYSKNSTFETVKQELISIGGYEINHHGAVYRC